MKKLFIHLGIHHTGTTFLQKKIFPFFDDESNKYYGKRYSQDNDYKIDKNFYYLSLKKFKRPTLNYKKNLYSSESILKPYIVKNSILKENLKKLKNDYNLKLLITIREPSQIIVTRLMKINPSLVDKKNYIEQVNKRLNFLYPGYF